MDARIFFEVDAFFGSARRIYEAISKVLRLRDTGVAAEVICQYVNVEEAALDGLYRITEAKRSAEHRKNTPETTCTDFSP